MSTATKSASDTKSLREKFGVTMQPIKAVRAFRKTMPFDHENITAESWIFITPSNQIVRANTYNGNAGKNYNPADTVRELPAENSKEYRKIFKGYDEVSIATSKIAEKA